MQQWISPSLYDHFDQVERAHGESKSWPVLSIANGGRTADAAERTEQLLSAKGHNIYSFEVYILPTGFLPLDNLIENRIRDFHSGTYPGFRPGGGHLLSKGPPGHPGAS